MLVPGFIDVQVNGGGGILFNDAPTVETIATIGRAHRQFGTTGFLPTLLSDDLSVVRESIRAVDAAIEAGVPGVLGIHIEGPFLNTRRRGIHDSSKIRELDDDGFETLTGLKNGRTCCHSHRSAPRGDDPPPLPTPGSSSRPVTPTAATRTSRRSSTSASPASPICSTPCRR
jgi:N-acetylglucosamine-6-phosphate deacetylase